eukprot:COSAG02_NODE_3692_length_6376_cov_17.973395_2_plen_115_part_00
MKLRAKSGSMANGAEAASFAASNKKLEKSVRFATDPVTNAFSAWQIPVQTVGSASEAAAAVNLAMKRIKEKFELPDQSQVTTQQSFVTRSVIAWPYSRKPFFMPFTPFDGAPTH